jgi:predicted ATPase/DNA-binding SARP family transcriptional activator
MADLKLYLFGPPRLERDGLTIEIGNRKALAALAYLVLNRRPQGRAALATLFWPDADAAGSRARLRRLLYDLNQAFGSLIDATSETVCLSPQAGLWVDVDEFRSLEACHGDALSEIETPHERLRCLEEAVGLAQGGFMEGFSLPDSPAFDDWQFFEGEGLRRSLENLLDLLAVQYQEIGEYQKAIQFSRRRISLDRLHEPAHRRLMELYALSGQGAAALRQYDQLVEILRDELDLDPEPESVQLFERIRNRELSPATQGAHPSKTFRTAEEQPDPSQTYHPAVVLPFEGLPFTGRTLELEQIRRLLSDPEIRIITLSGPGGAGKSRLAVQAARLAVDEEPDLFQDGVFFVPLAPLDQPRLILPTMAGVLFARQIHGQADLFQWFVEKLRDRRLLLILDNLEHLLDGGECAQLFVNLIDAVPGIKLFITSRTHLEVQAEQVVPLMGMRLPEPHELLVSSDMADRAREFSALRMFEQYARRSQPDFNLDTENIPHVLQICHLVDGMPLGVELAAAWLGLLTPAEIASEIQSSLDFLEASWRDMPDRQRSLRAVFETSWRILTPSEQDILRRLAVFRGGFTRQAANQVGGADLKTLLALIHKSWLQRGDDGRYQVHELLRHYALEQLNDDPELMGQVYDRHSRYMAALIKNLGELMKGSRQGDAFRQAGEEFQNIRLAWLNLVDEGQVSILKEMLYGLFRSQMFSPNIEEVITLLETTCMTLAENHNEPQVRPFLDCLRAVLHISLAAWFYYDIVESFSESEKQVLTEIYARLGEHTDEDLLYWYVMFTFQYGRVLDVRAALDRLEGYLSILNNRGSAWERTEALAVKGSLLIVAGRINEATPVLEEALDSYRKMGDFQQNFLVLTRVADLARLRRQFPEACALLEEGLALADRVGDSTGKNALLLQLAQVYKHMGDFEHLFSMLEENLEILTNGSSPTFLAHFYSVYSYEAVRHGDLHRALETRLQSNRICEAVQDEVNLAWGHWELGEYYRVAGDPAEARRWYDVAYEFFLSRQILGGIMFYERGLGDLAFTDGRFQDAYHHFEKSLVMAKDQNSWVAAYDLAGLARSAIALGKLDIVRTHLQESLRLANQHSDQGLALVAAETFANLLLAEGRLEEALELSAVVESAPNTWRETRSRAATVRENASAGLSDTKIQSILSKDHKLDPEQAIQQL